MDPNTVIGNVAVVGVIALGIIAIMTAIANYFR